MRPDHETPSIYLAADGETGTVERLDFRSRALHRQLEDLADAERASVVRDALELGAEVLERANRRTDLTELSAAVERLDVEAKRIVVQAAEHVERALEQSVGELAETLQGEDGPLAPLLEQFDLSADGNIVDLIRDLVGSATAKATKQAVKDLTEATSDTMERLTKSMAVIEKVAEVEQARLEEARKGTAKGLDHEGNTEALLGELVAVGGDSLDDVSTVPGLQGTKKGDKTITPRGGVTIVAEDKCTGRMSEAKIRSLLSEAMANRGARLGMLIVEDESKVPGRQPFHLIDDDKVVVVAERVTLRLVYNLFRARSIEMCQADRRTDGAGVRESVAVIRRLVQDIERGLERFRLVRTEHTKATKAIGQAAGYVDEIATGINERVTELVGVIEDLADDEAHEQAA